MWEVEVFYATHRHHHQVLTSDMPGRSEGLILLGGEQTSGKLRFFMPQTSTTTKVPFPPLLVEGHNLPPVIHSRAVLNTCLQHERVM